MFIILFDEDIFFIYNQGITSIGGAYMLDFIPGLIIGFREGLEAFLIVAIIIRFLKKTNRNDSIKYVWIGTSLGVLLSLLIGAILYLIFRSISDIDNVAKLWESGASLFALVLVTTFIIWMIKSESNITREIEGKVEKTISNIGIVILTFAMIAREGVEIAIFTFAGSYTLISIFSGVLISLILVVLVFFALIKVNLKLIFQITLIYLVLQAGFLIGYSIHEFASALKGLDMISSTHPIFNKMFDVSNTILDHKTGILGIPLYVLIGWYSKPEIIQFIVQYTYTISLFVFWIFHKKNHI